MRALIIAALLAVSTVATAQGVDSAYIRGKLNIHSLGAAQSGGTTYSGVSGMAQRNRPGISWARSSAHNDFSISSYSRLGCGYCGKTAVTGTGGSSNSSGGATVFVSGGNVDPVARYSADGGGYADTVVLREFQLRVNGGAEFDIDLGD